MPKGTINYSKSFIYKLCCSDINVKEIYIGSTTNMRRRKSEHKSDCNNEKQKKYYLYVYEFIREHGNFENWEMVLIENYDAKDNLDLRKRERYWKEELHASLNSYNPITTDEEDKEKHKEYAKEWYIINKEHLSKQRKEYYIINKEEIYKNKKEYNKLRFVCVCGSDVKKATKLRHERSKKHIDFIENQNDLDE
jgi:predicted GIY-YIG superfamily endonuclease